jgi:hypothetical protein
MELQDVDQGTVVSIHVRPNSSQFQVRVEDDGLVVCCRESPVKGRVNRELMKELSKLFKRRVEIVSGFRSKDKRILIQDASGEEVSLVLQRLNSGKM